MQNPAESRAITGAAGFPSGLQKLFTPVSDLIFRDGAHRVYAECDPRNPPSWRLLERLGFRREAHFRQNLYFLKDADGTPVWKDTYVYSLPESDAAD